jgi:hypothetical protein
MTTVDALLAWDDARLLVNRLKGERNAHRCEIADSDTPACYVGADDDRALWNADTSDWCEPCKQRHPIHQQIRPAIEARQKAQRRLYRAAELERQARYLPPKDYVDEGFIVRDEPKVTP